MDVFKRPHDSTDCECGEPGIKRSDSDWICLRCMNMQAATRYKKQKTTGEPETLIRVGSTIDWENYHGNLRPIAGIGESLKYLKVLEELYKNAA